MFYSIWEVISNFLGVSENTPDKTINELENEIIRLIRYFEKDVLHNVLSIISEYKFFTNEEAFDSQFNFINDILENHFKNTINSKFKFGKEWDTLFDKYAGLKESLGKGKSTFIKSLYFEKEPLLIELKRELEELDGLDELDIIKSFYRQKMYDLIQPPIVYLEGDLMRSVRIFTEF